MATALKVLERIDSPSPDNVVYIVEVSSGGSSARVRKSYSEFREYDDYCRQTDPSILVQLPGRASRFGDPKSKMQQYLQSMVELPNMMPILSEFLGVSPTLFEAAQRQENSVASSYSVSASSGSAGSGPRGPAAAGPPPVAPKPRGIGGVPMAAPVSFGNNNNARSKHAPSDTGSDSSGSGYDSAAFEEYVPPLSRPTAAGAGIEFDRTGRFQANASGRGGMPSMMPRSSPASPNGVPPAAPMKPTGLGNGRPPLNDDRAMKKLIIEALTAAQQAARHLLTKPASAQGETEDVASTMSATIHKYIDPEELHRWVQKHLTDGDVCSAFDKTTETMNEVEGEIVRRQQAPPVTAPRPGRPMVSPRSGMVRPGGFGRGGRISPSPTSSSIRSGFGGGRGGGLPSFGGRGTPSPSSSPPPMMSRTPPPTGGRASPRFGGGPPGGFRGGLPGRVTPSRATLTSGPPSGGRGGFGSGPPSGGFGARGGFNGAPASGGRGRGGGFGGPPSGGGSVGAAAGRAFAAARGGGGFGGSVRGGFGGGRGGFQQNGFNATQSSPNLFSDNFAQRNQSPTAGSSHSSDDAKSDAGSVAGRSHNGSRGGYVKTGVPYIDIYRGRKRRRKWSLSSPLLRMYLSQQHQKNLMKLMRNKPDPRFVFASHAVKVNKKFKKQPRILGLTSSNLYNIDATADSINREIPLEAIDSVSLSTKADNWLVVHVPSEYDYLFLCNHKTEFLMELRKQMKKLNKNLKLKFAKEIPYRLKSSHVHQITFPEQQNEVRNQKLAQEFTVNQLTNIEIILANRLHDDLLASDEEIQEFARKITSAVEQENR